MIFDCNLLFGVWRDIVKLICIFLFVNLWILCVKFEVDIVMWCVLIVNLLLLLIVCKNFNILV